MSGTHLRCRLADCDADLHAAQSLRYQVFVAELGGDGQTVNHVLGREADRFDAHASHLLVEDMSRPTKTRVIGTYRVMTQRQADAAGGYYSASEYDLTPLLRSGRPLLELGRSCVHPDYRGGPALFVMWQGLSRQVDLTGAEVLFGVASFHGTDPAKLAQPLAYLHHNHLAPDDLRMTALENSAEAPDILPPEQIDRRAALLAMPPLIKSYLRLGAVVGQGAFVDHAFNTTDVSLILDVNAMSDRQRALYQQGRAA